MMANTVASFGVLLKAAAETARAAAGLPTIERTIDSPLAGPYPSVRMYPLDEGMGQLEGVSLWGVSLRLDDLATDEWTRIEFRSKLIKAMGFETKSQANYRAQAPLYDFRVASDNPPAVGKLTLELVGARTWQTRREGDIWHSVSKFNLFSEGD